MTAVYDDTIAERRNNFLQKLIEIKSNSSNCHTLLSKSEVAEKIEKIERIKSSAGKLKAYALVFFERFEIFFHF